MKATEKQIKEWQDKYGKGNITEVHNGGKYAYLADPTNDLAKMKSLIAARRKSMQHYVDAIINNCWIAGDDAYKTDDAIKLGIEHRVDDIVNLPDPETTELTSGNVRLSFDGISIEIIKPSRMDIRYAEDRDKEGKPLTMVIYLLERIAVNQEELKALRLKVREYISVLFEIQKFKEEKLSDIKKF